MWNLMAWILFGSPLIVTATLMIRGTFKQRADLSSLRAEPRVDVPLNFNVDTARSGVNERYFSNRQNRDRASTFR
jgi:hypothetical protein